MSNCPILHDGVKLSSVSNCPRCQIVLLAWSVSNCPRCQIVCGVKLSHHLFKHICLKLKNCQKRSCVHCLHIIMWLCQNCRKQSLYIGSAILGSWWSLLPSALSLESKGYMLLAWSSHWVQGTYIGAGLQIESRQYRLEQHLLLCTFQGPAFFSASWRQEQWGKGHHLLSSQRSRNHFTLSHHFY